MLMRPDVCSLADCAIGEIEATLIPSRWIVRQISPLGDGPNHKRLDHHHIVP